METTEQITYRLFSEEDIDGILKLWELHSGWGSITAQQLNDWYLATPYGKCIIVVMTNAEDQILGEMMFIPARVYCNGKEYKCLKLSAPIIDEKYRQTNLMGGDHPISRFLETGYEAAKNEGFELLYTLPAYAWVPVIKRLSDLNAWNWQTSTYNCFSIPLENANNNRASITDEANVVQVFSYSNEHYKIWERYIAGKKNAVGVVREEKWLNWKFMGHLLLEVRQNKTNKLLGIVAIKPQTGLMSDVLAANDTDRQLVLAGIISELKRNKHLQEKYSLTKVTGMVIPFFDPFLQNTAHEIVDYNFAFGCASLNNAIALNEIHPSNWHILPED